jgi:hypothetical protein
LTRGEKIEIMCVLEAMYWYDSFCSAKLDVYPRKCRGKKPQKNTEVELQQKIDELKNVEEKIDNLLLVDNMKRKKRIRHVNGIPLMQKSCHIDFLVLSID